MNPSNSYEIMVVLVVEDFLFIGRGARVGGAALLGHDHVGNDQLVHFLPKPVRLSSLLPRHTYKLPG